MAVVMSAFWEGMTPEQYEACRKQVNWESQTPDGYLFHVASFSDNGLFVTTMWESEEYGQRFLEKRLMPVIQQLGFVGQPKVDFRPVYALFTPAFRPTRSISTLSPSSSSTSTRMQ